MRRRTGYINNRGMVQNHHQIVNVGMGGYDASQEAFCDPYYTLEEHLASFANDERFGYLWNKWKVEKGEYIRELSTIQKNFPEYSLHDQHHSAKIVAAIERLLGAERIALLSPSDAWLILQCAYTHDLGMCITEKERKMHLRTMTESEFKKLFSQPDIRADFDGQLDEIITKLSARNIHYPNTNDHDMVRVAADFWKTNKTKLFDDISFIDVLFGPEFSMARYYYDIIISEYYRGKHAERSRGKLLESKNRNIERDVIPGHMREAVAQVDYCHDGPPSGVMKVKKRQNGFGGDYIHPRFVAMLLRIGDLLDMETTRFNPYVLEELEDISSANMPYLLKDLSVTEFLVDEEKICITSSFETEQVRTFLGRHPAKSDVNDDVALTRLISKSIKCMRDWMDYINKNMAWFMQMWNEMIPDGFPGSIAAVNKLCILLDGEEVDERDMLLKYEIDSTRAMQIIEGAGIYDNRLVFLREIIQNAIDATNIMLYRAIPKYVDDEKRKLPLPEFMEKYCHLLEPAAIEVNINFENEEGKNYFVVEVIDKGIGITREQINRMRHIGAIRDNTIENDIRNMPTWLRPTASFGIGMQSAFLAADQFEIKTNPKAQEATSKNSGIRWQDMQHRVIFNSVKLGGDITCLDTVIGGNHTNITWDDKKGARYPYGTRFKLRTRVDISTDFTKNIIYLPAGISDIYYRQSLTYRLRKLSLAYIRKNFMTSIAPIVVNIEGEKPLRIESKFATAAVLSEKHTNIRTTDEEVFFWYDNGLDDAHAFCAMFAFTLSRKETKTATNTRLFYRGIRFNENPPDDFQQEQLLRLVNIPGFDCDINIMSGTADTYVEINRNYIKRESLNALAANIKDGLLGFYRYVISLISEMKDNTPPSGDVRIREAADTFLGMLPDAKEFMKMLVFLILTEKIRVSEDVERFFTKNSGSSFEVALFDNYEAKVAYVSEPLSMANLPQAWFVDYCPYNDKSVVQLAKDDARLCNEHKIKKALCNQYPAQYGLKFNQVEVYANADNMSRASRITLFYSLAKTQQRTNMDVNSYVVIVKDIIYEYTRMMRDDAVDVDYLPIFPAPPCHDPAFGLSEDAVRFIAVSCQPPADYHHCDSRFTAFVISPLPITFYVDIDGSEIFELILQHADKSPAEREEITNEYISTVLDKYRIDEYIAQTVAFIKHNVLDDGNEQINKLDETVASTKICEYMKKYAVCLVKMLLDTDR